MRMMEASTSSPVKSREAKEPSQLYSRRNLIGSVLGPLLGLAVWLLPFPADATVRHTLAIVVFMIVYWITEPMDHGVTALLGCFLFWALGIVKFQTAFAGFSDDTPWFLLGAMLMGEAASRSGLAERIGFRVMRVVGTSYSRLLLGIIIFVLILNFLVPSGMAQLSIIAPIVIGIVAAFGLGPLSNVGRGLFIILSYTCGLFNKMILAGGASILTRGLVEKMTGTPVYYSQYFMAYLPAVLITIFACWLCVLWLYPPEKKELPGGRAFIQNAIDNMGPWKFAEKKSLAWLLVAIGLWSTDLLHHISPSVIALGIGLMLALPKVGVLKTRDIREVNFLLIIFMGGALSMGQVLLETKALSVLTNVMMSWMTPLLSGSFWSASVLYWAAFLYHFILASELSMLSTSLPVIINFAQSNGYSALSFAMIWNFASGGKLFVYQSAVLILGYSYGYFETKDLIRVGLVLTIIEGIILIFIVPFYWPMLGLHWTQ